MELNKRQLPVPNAAVFFEIQHSFLVVDCINPPLPDGFYRILLICGNLLNHVYGRYCFNKIILLFTVISDINCNDASPIDLALQLSLHF